MTIIALDTATSILSVALVSGAFSTQKEQWYFEIDADQRHGELLMEVSDQLIRTAGIKPGDVDLVVCMKGPGSFTGLRIGFATAKGMALALKIPLLTVPTLDCMALSCSLWPGMVIPVMDAKKQSYFTAFYQKEQQITEYMDATPAQIADLIVQHSKNAPEITGGILLTGPDGGQVLPVLNALSSIAPYIQQIHLDSRGHKGWGKELLELAQRRLQAGNGELMQDLPARSEVFSGPLYLRKSDAELRLADPEVSLDGQGGTVSL
ncbi:putative tRNA threonylcarbamoyladenosine biosynthesis protein TsaB [Hollandina sp. SP2]